MRYHRKWIWIERAGYQTSYTGCAFLVCIEGSEKEGWRENGVPRNRDWGRFPLIFNKERKVVLFPPGFQTVWNPRGVKRASVPFPCLSLFHLPSSRRAVSLSAPSPVLYSFLAARRATPSFYWCCQFNFSWRTIVAGRKAASPPSTNRLYLSRLCAWQLLTFRLLAVSFFPYKKKFCLALHVVWFDKPIAFLRKWWFLSDKK